MSVIVTEYDRHRQTYNYNRGFGDSYEYGLSPGGRGFGQDPGEDIFTDVPQGGASSINLGATYGPTWGPLMSSVPGGSGTPGYIPPTTSTQNTGFWTSLASMFNSAVGKGSILASRYSVPQLAPGQLIQTSPYGTTMYQAPAGSAGMSIPGLPSSLGGSGIGTILLIGGAVLAIALVTKGK